MNHFPSLKNHSEFLIFLLLFSLIPAASPQTVQTQDLFTYEQSWGFGVLASFGVSLLGFVMSAIMILILRTKKLSVLTLKTIVILLISFAVSALLADAVVHIIPEVFGAHEHGEVATQGEEVATHGEEVSNTAHDQDHTEEEDHIEEHAVSGEEALDDGEQEHNDKEGGLVEEEHGEHAEEEHEEEGEPMPEITSLLIIIGFFAFVLLEKVFEWAGISHTHGYQACEHHHEEIKEAKEDPKQEAGAQIQHDPQQEGQVKIEIPTEKDAQPKEVELTQQAPLEDALQEIAKQSTPARETYDKIEDPLECHMHYLHEVSTEKAGVKEGPVTLDRIKSMPSKEQERQEYLTSGQGLSCWKTFCSLKGRRSGGIMVLLADFLHNIMDGLAIGVAFASGKKDLAISTFVAIVAHEVPQEISNMGILVESKFPLMQALCCNGMVNFSALVGALIGLGAGTISEAANAYVLAFVAGNFLYIAVVSMLPLVMQEIHGKTGIGIAVAFILGAGVQFALLPAEE